MQKRNYSLSFRYFLDEIRDDIRHSKFTQESLALNCLDMCRETLCRKLTSGDLSGKDLYILMLELGILNRRR